MTRREAFEAFLLARFGDHPTEANRRMVKLVTDDFLTPLGIDDHDSDPQPDLQAAKEQAHAA